MLERLKTILPPWAHDWLDVIVPGMQIALIVLAALLLHYIVRRLIRRASDHYQFPHELLAPVNAVVRWLILGGAVLLALERLGVSAGVLWTPGALGRVVDINLLYTTLEDATAPEPGTLLQIPNALIFQRIVRRWRAGMPVPPSKLHPEATPAAGAAESAPAPKAASFP